MRKAKPIHINAVQRAIESAQKLNNRDILNLKGIMTFAMNELRTGKGGKEEVYSLIDAFNTGEELSVLGICSDETSRNMIQNGQAVLADLFQRHKERGSWTLKGPEMWVLNEAIFMHGVQLEHCSLGEFTKAQKSVRDKSRQALAGNQPKGVTVLS